MNFLGHAVLSFDYPILLIGNLMNDFIKGKDRKNISSELNNGILLHLHIDKQTDEHLFTKKLKDLLRQDYGLYSSPVADILIDYFVANNINIFSTEEHLYNFSQKTYTHIENNSHLFNERFSNAFKSMKTNNWLYNYRSYYGIERSLTGLKNKASNLPDINNALNTLQNNEIELAIDFNIFWNEMYESTFKFINKQKDS